MSKVSPPEVEIGISKCRDAVYSFEIAASIAGKEVGCASLYTAGSKLELRHLGVAPEYRGQGIGSLLVERTVILGRETKRVNRVETSAYNERTAKAFCRMFKPDELKFWLCGSAQNDYIETPMDATPDEVVEYLRERRNEEFGDSVDFPNSEHLKSGIRIKGQLTPGSLFDANDRASYAAA